MLQLVVGETKSIDSKQKQTTEIQNRRISVSQLGSFCSQPCPLVRFGLCHAAKAQYGYEGLL